MGLVLWVIPVITVLAIAFFNRSKMLHIASITAAAIMMVAAGIVTGGVMLSGKVEYAAFGGIFYVDSVSVIILDIVVVIGLMACIYSAGYLEEELKHEKIDLRRFKLYYILMHTFMFTMVFAMTVKNMGIMWIAIEATTLASAFLVGFYNDKKALEAAWKYVIICSVGIAIALMGIIFLHLSSVGVIDGKHLLDWTAFFNNAKALKSPILRLAFIFILIGFGTKAGLAPMHTWLPDAHSQAPSPISALLSGVLLNSAMYAIIRTVSIVNKNLGGSDFTGTLLIAAGLLSIGTAAIFILTQKDYKRLLAYSSIEHMGVIAFGIGIFTPASVFAALFHMINHSFTKSMLFLSSGNILQKYGTRDISRVRGLLKVLPFTGMAFLLGMFAIAGTPPFSVFASEFNVIVSAFEKNSFLLGAVFVMMVSFVFVGMALTLFKMFYAKGGAPEASDVIPGQAEQLSAGEANVPGTVVIMLLLVVITVTGLFMPESIKNLIINAQRIIIGG